MRAQDRRREMVRDLMAATDAVPGHVLAEKYGVSRQIIVQDIAYLKTHGYDIFATHNGYRIGKTELHERVFKVKHTTAQTEDELQTIVDLGGIVTDVFVWHKVYGKVQATLNIFSRDRVKQFLDGVRSGASSELMNITGGYHYHTVSAESEAVLSAIADALAAKGYIVPEL